MHRTTDLTFYDELGVARNATPAEIRDSFRSLVRILHPDHQLDDQLKEIAERQMRKLNRVYAVLSDAEQRRRYDEDLLDEGIGHTIILSPQASVNVNRLMGRLAWFAALCLTGAVLFWLASESPAAHVPAYAEHSPPKPSTTGGATPVTLSDEVYRLRAEVRNLTAERDFALRELVRLRGSSVRIPSARLPAEPAPAPSMPLPTTMTELPAPAPQPPALSINPGPRTATPKPVSAGVRTFAGFWFYAKPAASQSAKASALYPPEFIEASITEQNGVVRGRYRSRYKIVDRAISPDVNFEFSGIPNGATLVCPWTGGGGSRGELTLKIAGDNSLKVDWTAIELGSTQGLINGTATLTRRIDQVF